MIYLDTETCGFHGLAVLLQYSEDDGPVKIWEFWKEPIGESLELIEWIADRPVCAFNLAFDWFHLYKIWTTFSLILVSKGGDFIPEDDIDAVAIAEEKARDYRFCLKPRSCCDLMLHARKGKYQSFMRRRPIVIRRVPTQLVAFVCQELEKRTKIDDAYFSKRKHPDSPRWVVKDIDNPDGTINVAFKNIELEFNASTSLKTLAKYALGVEDDFILKFTDISISKKMNPKEYGYAPFALAVGRPGRWNHGWPEVIHHHIDHWHYNQLARKYAENDVVYLRQLHEHLDSPEPGDTDSELAAMVACVRWRGFEIKLDDIKIIREEEKRKLESVPTAPNAVKVWLLEVMSKTESIVLHNGTGEEILNSILTEWTENPKLIERVQAVLDARHAMKEIELYDKLIKARKFHASFKVIGSLSTRMSGSDDLNPQGIKGTYKVRNLFPLKREGFLLCGGDFDAFEVSIAESVYNDQNLRHDILSGKSPHGLFACELYPEKTYEEIEATKKTDNDLYGNGKTAFFRLMYGGNWQGMVDILNVEPEVAERAFNSFLKKYSGIGDHRDSINSSFCSMTQPAGIGTQVVWKDPCDYIDNGLGFKRYFSLENQMCKMLFDLANEPPKHWKYIKAKVLRKDRQQTACGAAQSALYAAAFNIQARNLRAAANHQIQSKGAQITKEVQRSIWDIQPIGVHDWVVQPMNIHDEIMCPTRPDSASKVKMAVEVVVQKYREIVPLLSITWKEDMESWARK